MSISRRLGTLALLLTLMGGLTAAPAWAHTRLVAADPIAGATIAAVNRVVLTYADPVILPRMVVRDSHGGDHVAHIASEPGNKVTAELTGPLAPGRYTVGWRVVAPDGHPVSGEYTFSITRSPALTVTDVATPPATATATHSKSTGSSFGWGWVALIVMGIAIIAGLIASISRRRSQA